LVFIILSQMTTHHSFQRVFDRIKLMTSGWDDLVEMRLDRVVGLIKDAGLSRQKAPRLQGLLRKVAADFGALTLEPLKAMSDEDTVAYLTSLPGVGTKTAFCVMMYSLGRQVLPVDTHVWRVCRRLGLISDKLPYGHVHDVLATVVPPRHRYTLHVNAISLGRDRCLPHVPRCGGCPLQRICVHGRTRIRNAHAKRPRTKKRGRSS
jgi:endonuclease III